MKTDQELKEGLMEEIRREMIVSKVKIRVFTRNIVKPKTMGKPEALEGLGAYNKRLKTLEGNLKEYEEYDVSRI